MFPTATEYIVRARKKETPTTQTLMLTRTDGASPQFRAGQHITVYFPDLSPTLGKQYSISCAPREGMFSITVKAIGRFSSRLCSLAEGDRFLASGPNGDFYPEMDGPVVLIAGGMGITPLRSILIERMSTRLHRPTTLLYSSKFLRDMPFSEELGILSTLQPSVVIKLFVTRETPSASGVHYRRMQPADLVYSASRMRTEFLISGSLSFVLGMKNILVAQGINRTFIQTESYF